MLDLLLVPLGLMVGAYGTLVGAGGGFVLVPILLLLYPDERPVDITAISLAVVFFNAASGSVAYARIKRIDYLTGLIFATAALPGSVAGAYLVSAVPRRAFDLVFGVVLLVLAAYVWWGSGRPVPIRATPRGRGVITRVMPGGDEGATFRYSYGVWQGVAFSIAVGFLSSLLGIGGGIMHVPVMVTVLHFPVHIAVATSHLVLAVIAGSGSVVHLSNGDLAGSNLTRSLLLGIGAIPGAQIGARLAQRFKGPAILRLLTLALGGLGVRLLMVALAS